MSMRGLKSSSWREVQRLTAPAANRDHRFPATTGVDLRLVGFKFFWAENASGLDGAGEAALAHVVLFGDGEPLVLLGRRKLGDRVMVFKL